MSVYVGIDVHRKRSQVAVIDADGGVIANRNVPNAAEPILKVIGGLPPGTPAAFEAAYGTSWLVELLEDYGFAPHLVHPSRCTAIASAGLAHRPPEASTPVHGKPQPSGLSSRAIIGRRSRASSSFVPARALTGANGCGRSSLTRGRAPARNQQLRGNPAQQPTPGDYQVTGPGQHALFDSESPHGWVFGAAAAPD